MIIKLNNIILTSLFLINILVMPSIPNFIIGFPLIILLLFYFLILNYPYSYSIVKYSFKDSLTIKLLALFFISLLVSWLVNFAINGAGFVNFMVTLLGGYIFNFILVFCIGYLSAFFINIKRLIKIQMLVLFFLIFLGLVEFLLCKCCIGVVYKLFPIICGRGLESIMGYINYSFPRIQSIFNEPAHFAWFMVCNIPITITIFNAKYCIFKNKLFDKLIKRGTLPLLFISLFLTQSAMFIIFAPIVTIIYLIIKSKISIKTLLGISILGLMLLYAIINCADYYYPLKRILNTIASFGNFQTLVIAEPSLATRIVTYTNMFIIFLKHPLFGVSSGSLYNYFVNQLTHSPLILTKELLEKYIYVYGRISSLNPIISYRVLAENGLFGASLFYSFLISISINIKKIIKIINSSFIKDYLKGVNLTLITFICLTFYDSQLFCHYFWLMFGCISGFRLKLIIEKEGQCNQSKWYEKYFIQ